MIDEDIDEINLLFYIKDRFNVLNEVYYEFIMICKDKIGLGKLIGNGIYI